MITTTVLLLIYGMIDGYKDAAVFHPSKVFKVLKSQYFIPSGSWKNKYKKTKLGELMPYSKKWYHFGKSPAYAEAFPFSTTLFVSLTDGWHLLKSVSLWALVLALFTVTQTDINFTHLLFVNICIVIIWARIWIGVGFYITYNLIF